MKLTAAQIRALAPAPGYRKIDRYLPDPYRRALADKLTPMAQITKSWRDALKRIEHELALVQRSRSVAFFTDLDDGGRLGALHDQAPWPEEDVEAFRTRLAGVAALAVEGAASAGRMLSLIGLATGSRRVHTLRPDRNDTTDRLDGGGRPIQTDRRVVIGETSRLVATGQGQTTGTFVKPGETGVILHGSVFDAPKRLYQQVAEPLRAPGYTFKLKNVAYATLPTLLGDGSRTYPNPVFTLEASAPFGPLMLVQTFDDPPERAPRVIVINRRLRAGSKLVVDVSQMAWNHDEGTATTEGTWQLGAGREDLYAGLSEIASTRSFFDNEPADLAAGYAMALRTKAGLVFDGALEDLMIDKGAIPGGADDKIQMPSLMGQGTSLWRVIQVLPDPDGSDDIRNATFAPLPADAALKITARWAGRRAGEFAVVVEDRHLDIGSDGPLPHRAAWLDAMIDRFKLAGTVRVTPLLEDLFQGQSDPDLQLALASRVELGDGIDIDRWGEFESTIETGDAVEITPELPIAFESGVEVSDSFELQDAGARMALESGVEVADTLDIVPAVETAFESGVELSDSFTIEVLDQLDGPAPTDDTRRRPAPDPVTVTLTDRVRVSDRVTIRPLRR